MWAHIPICLAGGAALVAGADLAGFQIAMEPSLLVVYGSTNATGGVVVAKNVTAQAPILAVPSAVTASSLAIMMVDLDIPSSTQPTTFLHWLQTDLVVSKSIETIMTSKGNMKGFGVSLAKNTTAIVAYTQPDPPAQNPLSHRYTQILLNTSALTSSGLTALQTAAKSRVNFNIATTLQQAGLSQSVVAWNFFNVTNSGASASTASTGTSTKGSTSSSSTSGNTTATTGSKGGKKGKGSDGTATVASNSTTSDDGTKSGKKGKGSGSAATNSTSAAGSSASGSGTSTTKGKGGKNSTTPSTPSASTVGMGSLSGSGSNVSTGSVASNSSVPKTVTTSGSPDRWAWHSVALSLCLAGVATLAL